VKYVVELEVPLPNIGIGSEGIAEVFLEVVRPPLSLVLTGAGPNSIPLVRLAAHLGWQVTVADHRPALATRTRFPEAREVIVCRPEELNEHLKPDDRTAAVIMTHQFQNDLAFLRALLTNELPKYVGLLGHFGRRNLLFEKLEENGFMMTPERRARVFGPVGLDLGAESPDEIALAIIAEIQTVFSGRSGGFMKDRTSPIR